MKSNEFYGPHPPPVPAVKDRPKCPCCGKTLAVEINFANDNKRMESIVKQIKHDKGEIVSWRYKGYGHFCSLTCGTRWANNVFDKRISI